MVFSNSKQGVPLSQTSSSTPYPQHSMVRLPRRQIEFYWQLLQSEWSLLSHRMWIGPLTSHFNSYNENVWYSLLISVWLLQVSMLNKGFGDVGDPKGASTGTTGSQFLEQYKTAQVLAQLAAQQSQTGPSNTTASSWDTSASSLGQYGELN